MRAGLAMALGLVATAAATVRADSARAQSIQGGMWTFQSEPSVYPAALEITDPTPPAPTELPGGTVAAERVEQARGDLFFAPIKNFAHPGNLVGKPGPEIVEQDGNLIWEHPLGEPIAVEGLTREKVAMDFHAASYDGQPVLVWWEGYISPAGYGNGVWEIVNQHYQPVASVHAPPGFAMDFHDIQLTNHGTAYVIADRLVNVSLTCCGGASNGDIYDEVIFELSVKTGRVLWGWDPLKHVPLRDSYTVPPSDHSAWDPYHINSIAFSASGNVIVSMRNTWAAYWINRYSTKENGSVFAILGGRRSTFKLGPNAQFAWQHDVLPEANGDVSIFDDEATPAVGKQSRGLVLALSFSGHTATVVQEYVLPQHAYTGSQGNLQVLPNGNLLVGWGQLPYISEYDPEGYLLYLAAYPGPDESYRAFRSPWIGLPLTRPALKVLIEGTGVRAYASWNGATQVTSWQLWAGASPAELTAAGPPVPREQFETMLASTELTSWYAVQAFSAKGRVLGTSAAVPPREPTAVAAPAPAATPPASTGAAQASAGAP